MEFDPNPLNEKLKILWSEPREFGKGRSNKHVYLKEILPDRFILDRSFNLITDPMRVKPEPIGADFSIPTIVSTLAHTNCIDRACQGQTVKEYEQMVGTRYAWGDPMGYKNIEKDFPLGGGTEHANTFANVTVHHARDSRLRDRLYAGNPKSYFLHNFDIQTHVGRLDRNGSITFGKTQETEDFEPRAACGAVVETFEKYDESNELHERIVRELGEDNFDYLRTNRIMTKEGIDITYAVASSIIAIQGMHNVASSLTQIMGEREVAHITASTVVNRAEMDDPVIYLARTTVFNGKIQYQGIGANARKYSGVLDPHEGNEKDLRLVLVYDGVRESNFPVKAQDYKIKK